MTDLVLAVAARVAAVSPTPSPSQSISERATDDNIVRPGWLGFAVFLAMALALFFLLRSFVKHLHRIDFDEGTKPAGTAAAPQAEPPTPTADDS